MATIPQIDANRQNAQLSTGPQSEQGKAAVSQNALKYGLTSVFDVLPHEDQDEFDALVESYRDEFKPAGQHQNFLINQMAQARWRLARTQRLEVCLLELMMDPDASPTSPDGRIVAGMLKRSADPIAAFQRYAAAAERSYYKANREFQTALKDGRKQQDAEMDAMLDSMCGLPRMPIPSPISPAPLYATPAGQASAATNVPLRT